MKRILAYLQTILPDKCTFMRYLFGVLKHPMARVWAIESKGILWRARCKLVHDKHKTDMKQLFIDTYIAVKLALSTKSNRAKFECNIYDHSENKFIF